MVYVALRSNGKLGVLDPYWIFQAEFKGDCVLNDDHSEVRIRLITNLGTVTCSCEKRLEE